REAGKDLPPAGASVIETARIGRDDLVEANRDGVSIERCVPLSLGVHHDAQVGNRPVQCGVGGAVHHAASAKCFGTLIGLIAPSMRMDFLLTFTTLRTP